MEGVSKKFGEVTNKDYSTALKSTSASVGIIMSGRLDRVTIFFLL